MKSRLIAIAAVCGALAVPAVALAAGGDGEDQSRAPTTAPVQQQEQQQPDQQRPQPPNPEDCPERDGQRPEGQAPEDGSGSDGSSSNTLL
jgi:hypothetical protein